MLQLSLIEYAQSPPVAFNNRQLVALNTLLPQMRIAPCTNLEGHYILTPDSRVGVVRLPGLQLDIRPKIPIDRLFFILSYAIDPTRWQSEPVHLNRDDSVLEAVAPLLCRQIAAATRRGLLHGYQSRDEALHTIRGQIRFSDQLRLHHGRLLPVELRYDEHTVDILENQILLAALRKMHQMPLRSVLVRRSLQEIMAAFHAVTPFSCPAGRFPQFTFNRLNQHYEHAIQLALLVLKAGSLEPGLPYIQADGFLLDMNKVFELFVHRALRESLALSETSFPLGDSRLRLDVDGNVELAPDLSLWQRGKCRFVGDIKYKRINDDAKNADVYQLLAYTIAANVPQGLLIYAKSEGKVAEHTVRHVDKRLHTRSLDLEQSPAAILADIDRIAAAYIAPYLASGARQTTTDV